MSDAFHKSSFFLNDLMLLYDSEQLKLQSVSCFSVCVSSVLANKTFSVLPSASGFLYFLIIPLIASNM